VDYATIKAQLRGLINRSDMTDELAGTFIQMAQDRLERWPQVDPLKYAPRPSFMEKYVTLTLTPSVDEPGAFALPNDFLQLISIFTGSRELEKVDISRFIALPETEGSPTAFIQTGHAIRMRPIPPTTTSISFLYYGTAKALSLATDENEWTIAASDALIYGAAVFAADHFEDERLDRFEGRFSQALLELQDQTINETLSGPMRIAGAYDYQDELP
jgi:hypothetical protein